VDSSDPSVGDYGWVCLDGFVDVAEEFGWVVVGGRLFIAPSIESDDLPRRVT
jgi:hypothetical protein